MKLHYTPRCGVAPFFRTHPLLYHTFENMVFFRSGTLYSLCSPANQDYQKIIHFKFFSPKKVQIDNAKVNNSLIMLVSWATK